MTNDGKARPLSAIVGERLRDFREAKSLRQADIAAAAAQAGLSWSRSSIAALEAGSRNLSVEELLVLPHVLLNAGGWDEPLIPPTAYIEMNGGRRIKASIIPQLAAALTNVARWTPDSVAPEEEEINFLGQESRALDHGLEDARMHARYGALRTFFAQAYPQFSYEQTAQDRNFDGDLTSKIAARIAPSMDHGVRFNLARFLPVALWGRPAHEERDLRTARRGEYESKRSLQAARGHATREMIEELNQEIENRQELITSIFSQLERIWDDKDELTDWFFAKDPRNSMPKL
ncbi:helix-turn-helix domain-containing protein [Streptomyces tibetensis]|uniref:helix-turn-helix domain-containing protein n=1 Tax=Streptomyces tibetensis TaxID=2382123 RepID=UPI0033C7ECD4